MSPLDPSEDLLREVERLRRENADLRRRLGEPPAPPPVPLPGNPPATPRLRANGLTPLSVLRNFFGHTAFRPGQEKIIQAVLEGKDCIAVMPTGAGKSVTFQVPSKILAGTVLVLSPLISLMKDQVDALLRRGFKATLINSTLSFEERRARLGGLRRGEWELVYLAPEALDGSLRDFIQDCPIGLVVVDEAHCISSWGHDFRPAYRRLSGLRAQLGNLPILALTATATGKVTADIRKQLGMESPVEHRGTFFRSNLRLMCQKKGGGRDARQELVRYLQGRSGDSGIVYCLTRKNVESVAEHLQSHGLPAAAYHAGLPDRERARVQENFLSGRTPIAVATIAFGMGIDKPDVRFVVHRDMPKTIESYVQEIGRAGRDGKPSDCVLFYSWADVIAYDHFTAEVSDPRVAADLRLRTREMFEWAERAECRHRGLAAHFDETMDPCGASCDVCTGRSWDDHRRSFAPDPLPAARRSAARPRAVTAPEDPLFERLRQLRRTLADQQRVPAYMVFHDSVLKKMAEERPQTREALSRVPGIGPAKLAAYGDEFLKVFN